jgi:large subunit ribosomal protein L3
VLGLVGKKIGMTRVFAEDGHAIPVSIVEVQPNRITQIKTPESDGYAAIQVTIGQKKASRVTKPLAGHYAKANVEPGDGLWEFRFDALSKQNVEFKVGNTLTVKLLEAVAKVDVVGTSKGKGFAGVIKRHHFAAQDATHGNSLSHRAPGSIGQRQSPGKVFKGKKMSGHLGNKQITTQSLTLVKFDEEKNLLFIEGAVPGAPGSIVMIYPAIKTKTKSSRKDGGKK